MSNAPTMTTHTATDCMARCYGTCGRVHVGDVVRVVVGPQLGYMQYGNVVAASGNSATVNFPDGAVILDSETVDEDLTYFEDELEVVSV